MDSFLKLDRDGHVWVRWANGSGIGNRQFIEATYMAWDKDGMSIPRDTSGGSVTRMLAPH